MAGTFDDEMLTAVRSAPAAATAIATSGEAAIGSTFTSLMYTPGMSPLKIAATGAQIRLSDSDSSVTAMVK